MTSENLEDRIAKMRSRLMRGEDVAEDMGAMDARLDAIEVKLDKILKMLEPQKTPAKKASPKKRTTTRKTSK